MLPSLCCALVEGFGTGVFDVVNANASIVKTSCYQKRVIRVDVQAEHTALSFVNKLREGGVLHGVVKDEPSRLFGEVIYEIRQSRFKRLINSIQNIFIYAIRDQGDDLYNIEQRTLTSKPIGTNLSLQSLCTHIIISRWCCFC